MSTVSVHLGITYPGSKQFSSFRADVTISDIDVKMDLSDEKRSKDIEEQLKEALAASVKIGETAEEAVAQQAANASGLAVEGVGLASEFYGFKEALKKWQENVVDQVKKLKDQIEPMKEVEKEDKKKK